MRLVRYIAVALAAMATLALVSCGSEPRPTARPTATAVPTATSSPSPTATPEPSTVIVRDDMGREVEIPYRPKRLAVTNAFMVELTMACGYRPVARPDISPEFIYPLEAHDIPSFGVSHSAGPNLEQLAAARPDLLIASPIYVRFIPAIEEALGIPVLVHDVTSVNGITDKIRAYGGMLGCEQKAEMAAQDLTGRIDTLREGLPEEGPTALALFGTNDVFLSLTSGSYMGDMINLMGGTLVNEGDPPFVDSRSGPTNQYTSFSMEKIVERNPDVILVVRHGNPSEAREQHFASLFNDPAWGGLKAVEEGRVHELSEWLFVRYPGPRVVLGLEQLRPLMYPQE